MKSAFRRVVISVGVVLFLGLDVGHGASPAVAPVTIVPIERGTVFQRYVAGENADAVAGDAERLIYSTTFGTLAVAPIGNLLFADEISTVAATGCPLRRIEFPVVGKVDPAGVGGPFSVEFALYTSCPGSVPANILPSIIRPGSFVRLEFSDDAPRLISYTLPGAGLTIPNTVWFGVRFNRANAGMVMGGPALTGFSSDLIDFPGFACNAWLGGFPENPYANFNLQFFGDASCASSFVGYKNSRPSGPTFNPGVGHTLTDDIRLGVDGCRLTGYEVAVRGVGNYSFDLRNSCEASPIEGTQRSYNVPSGTEPRIARFAFDPPIKIPRDVSFAATVNNPESGVIVSGLQASVGVTQDFFEVPSEVGDCTEISHPSPGIHAGVNLTILCEGEPPVGACCDMFFADENGESVCRQVPQMNCPFPPFFSGQRPEWVQGAACSPDPFILTTGSPCGRSACCKPDGSCANLTVNECNAVLPLDRPRQWQRGFFCGQQSQQCPNPCIGAVGYCSEPHDTPGCSDLWCCTAVCQLDFFCCTIAWDATCVSDTNFGYCELPIGGDVCAPTIRYEGARLLAIPGTTETPASRATKSFDDPGFGCYVGDPGSQGEQTVWYKFIAPPAIAPATRSNVNLSTCASPAPADDSLLQVFAVGDPTNPYTQCHSLIPFGCSDNFSGLGCTRVGTLSSLCLRDLIPGSWYYVVQAAKVPETSSSARYRVTTSQVSACASGPFPDETNDFCPRAVAISDGVTPFNMAINPLPTLDPPIESCIPTMTNDIWYDYTASCTGRLTVETCGANALSSPDTNLAIYDGLACPMINNPIATIGCSTDAGDDCGFGSKLVIDAVQGHGYKIRLADTSDNRPSGNLTISCVQAACPAGEIAMVAPLEGVVDARRPHSPSSATPLEGIQAIKVTLTRDAQPSCFTLCETAVSGSPNVIDSVVQGPLGVYTVTLHRPITPGAKTTLIYTDNNGGISYAHVISHPGNVRGDGTTSGQDVLDLRDALLGTFALPWGLFSGDLNRSYTGNEFKSSGITPADMLEAVDLVNGGRAYDPWINTPNPTNDPGCP